MGGHRDDLEYDFSKPVISISLGLPSIFLLGGKDRNNYAVPILVRPGDVMVLGGDCRLHYHGMARVVVPSSSRQKEGGKEYNEDNKLQWLPQIDANLKELCETYWINDWSDIGIQEEEEEAQKEKKGQPMIPESDRCA
eukprot:13271547-Ditylum_brightwellii.AAC.1